MAHNAYLTVEGEKQGLISRGCNTLSSLGGKYQVNHIDEITVASTEHMMMKLPDQQAKTHNPVIITKFIDKSTPLLAMAFARQEYLNCKLNFYRTNEQGYYENFFSIELKKALITSISLSQPHTQLAHKEEMTEEISSYTQVTSKCRIQNTSINTVQGR